MLTIANIIELPKELFQGSTLEPFWHIF